MDVTSARLADLQSVADLWKHTTMADLRFSGGGSDRRRRMLTNDLDPGADTEFEVLVPFSGTAAFPLLSRDRLIRRFISPRLWKHAVLVGVWTLLPVAVAIVWMTTNVLNSTSVPGSHAAGIASIVRGLSGLELFLASQFCLLIYWVRSASAVDFRGGYRSWRWMSIILLMASLLLITGASFALTDLIASGLEPLLGEIRSARPALLFVPAGAVTAFVLRFLIPEMGRCRAAQILAISGAMVAFFRVVAGLRWPTGIPAEALAILELLTSGFVLSAFELQCRYVIHVNPHPPVAAKPEGDVSKCEAERIEVASTVETISSEPVEVFAMSESTPAPVDVTPSPLSSATDIAIPSNGQYAGSGSKASRKKQRKAG